MPFFLLQPHAPKSILEFLPMLMVEGRRETGARLVLWHERTARGEVLCQGKITGVIVDERHALLNPEVAQLASVEGHNGLMARIVEIVQRIQVAFPGVDKTLLTACKFIERVDFGPERGAVLLNGRVGMMCQAEVFALHPHVDIVVGPVGAGEDFVGSLGIVEEKVGSVYPGVGAVHVTWAEAVLFVHEVIVEAHVKVRACDGGTDARGFDGAFDEGFLTGQEQALIVPGCRLTIRVVPEALRPEGPEHGVSFDEGADVDEFIFAQVGALGAEEDAS